MRTEIRRKFKAMINKEKEVKCNKREKHEEDSEILNQEIKVVPKVSKVVEAKGQEKNSDFAPEETETFLPSNLHSPDCKTCVRMETLMGRILPHPLNM